MYSNDRLAPSKLLQSRAAIARLSRLACKEETEFRGDIQAAERIDFNHLYKGFFQDLMILRYYAVDGGSPQASSPPRSTGGSTTRRSQSPRSSSGRVQLTPIKSKLPPKKSSKNNQQTATVFGAETAELRLKKASCVYHTGAVRTDNVRALPRSHYNHPVPGAHLAAMQQQHEDVDEYCQKYSVLPSRGRSLALKSLLVEEARARDSVLGAEKEWRRWRQDQEVMLRVKARQEGKLMAVVHETEGMPTFTNMSSTELKVHRQLLRDFERIEREEGTVRIYVTEDERIGRRKLARSFERHLIATVEEVVVAREKARETSCAGLQAIARNRLATEAVARRRATHRT